MEMLGSNHGKLLSPVVNFKISDYNFKDILSMIDLQLESKKIDLSIGGFPYEIHKCIISSFRRE